MIKTFSMTNVILASLAVVSVGFPAFFGPRKDPQIEEFLKSPGITEKFNAGQSLAEKTDASGSPLVKQAQALAQYLNPPKPVEPELPVVPGPEMPRPAEVAAKFELIGTSYYAAHPELSLALVDEPGKGLRWIRQAGQVGHLVIEQVNDGQIVVRDGEKTFEMTAPRPEKPSLLKGASQTSSSVPAPEPAEQAGAAPGQAKVARPRRTPPRADLQKSVELMNKILDQYKSKPPPAGSNIGDENRRAPSKELFEKLKSDIESMRISTQEANQLGSLGRQLQVPPSDPNRKPPASLGRRSIKRTPRPRPQSADPPAPKP